MDHIIWSLSVFGFATFLWSENRLSYLQKIEAELGIALKKDA
jgi:hypothetical protein